MFFSLAISAWLVIGISDGNTLTLLSPDQAAGQVRLAEIDAPELDNPLVPGSKQPVSDLCRDHRSQLAMTVYGRAFSSSLCRGPPCIPFIVHNVG